MKDAQDELAEISGRGREPARKRLELVSHLQATEEAQFFNTVFVQHPLDFSQPGVIRLGVGLMGNSSKHNFLINRSFHVGEGLALEFIEKRTSVMVVGSKGVGKSCLGLVIVSKLLKEDQVVAYEYSDIRMLLVPSKAALDRFSTEGIKRSFAEHGFDMVHEAGMYVFDKPEEASLYNKLRLLKTLVHVVYLGDLAGRVKVDHSQIIISSPNSDKLKRFEELEERLKYVIYPPWTWKEIVTLNANLGTMKQDDDVLKDKFLVFGGVPRLIFKAETADEAREDLVKKIDNVPLSTWKDVFISTKFSEIPALTPGALVAITPNAPTENRRFRVCFATDFVMQSVIRRYAISERAALISLLQASSGSQRMMSSLQGYLLEEAMHAALLSAAPGT